MMYGLELNLLYIKKVSFLPLSVDLVFCQLGLTDLA